MRSRGLRITRMTEIPTRIRDEKRRSSLTILGYILTTFFAYLHPKIKALITFRIRDSLIDMLLSCVSFIRAFTRH